MARAVLYVLAPTFSGGILQSMGCCVSSMSNKKQGEHTSNFQVLSTINIEPRIYDATLIARFHGAGSELSNGQYKSVEDLITRTECHVVSTEVQ
jgi:hypothetical protein